MESIKRAKEFSIWLHEMTNERDISSTSRVQTGLAFLQLSIDIANAIIVLLEAKLPGPALSLARPLFEGFVRGIWLLEFALDKQIEQFNNGKCPRFPDLLEVVGNGDAAGGAWIHANKNANWSSFNDLTHGGSEHVKRRCTQEAVEANYPESELVALVQFGIEIRIRIGAELFILMDDEMAMEQLNEKATIFRIALKSSV
jgi:hypothetical protein